DRDPGLPAARPGHPAPRAAVPGVGEGLRLDQGALRVLAQALRRIPDRPEHGAARPRERAAGRAPRRAALLGGHPVYLAFYGLHEKPFGATPDPRFLYLAPSHREALAQLVYGVQEKKGFLVLTGEVGTGKTTLLHALLGRFDG